MCELPLHAVVKTVPFRRLFLVFVFLTVAAGLVSLSAAAEYSDPSFTEESQTVAYTETATVELTSDEDDVF